MIPVNVIITTQDDNESILTLKRLVFWYICMLCCYCQVNRYISLILYVRYMQGDYCLLVTKTKD